MLVKGIHVLNHLLVSKTDLIVDRYLSHFRCTFGHLKVWTKLFFIRSLPLKKIKTVSSDLLLIICFKATLKSFIVLLLFHVVFYSLLAIFWFLKYFTAFLESNVILKTFRLLNRDASVSFYWWALLWLEYFFFLAL